MTKKLASLGPKCKAEIKLELRFLSKFKNFSLPVNAIYRLTNPQFTVTPAFMSTCHSPSPGKRIWLYNSRINNVCAFTELAI